MALADAHLHLYEYSEEALDQALARARQKGIERVISLSVDLDTSTTVLRQAEGRDMVSTGVGLHPWWIAGPMTDWSYRTLKRMARKGMDKGRLVFIGEVGLDKNRNADRWEGQVQVLTRQVHLAKELDLPLNIHCRGADAELVELLRREGVPPRGGLIHGFNGDVEEMKRYLDLGFSISLGRGALRPEGQMAQVIQQCPLERLLVETDSTAHSQQTEGYEPATVATVAENVAQVRGMPLEALARVTSANLAHLIGR
ncbi:MAG: TatD family hydrolase [Chloroflexi bacterium]|nr:TatD family hydrolase [Chloroflexota bacterium]